MYNISPTNAPRRATSPPARCSATTPSISDNGFYVKPTEAGRKLLRTEVMRPPYEGAKPYFYIEEVDDHDYLAALVKTTCTELPEPKPKNKSKKK